MTTHTHSSTRMAAGSARAGYSLRDMIFAFVFVLLPYAAMAGILLLRG